MLPSLQGVNISAASSWRKNPQAFQSEWERPTEGFFSGDNFRSPISSPPDILWSSSGSSDIDMASRSRALRVVTRLDFDSCVVQSPDACRQFRARVTRNIINVDRGDTILHHSKVSVSEDNKGHMSLDVSDAKSVNHQVEQAEVKQEDSISESCCIKTFSENLVHHFNETNESDFCLQKSPNHISGTLTVNNIIVSSPIIGNQNKMLSPGQRSFHDRKWRRKKRRREVNDSKQKGHTSSPVIGSHRKGKKGSYKLNKKTEKELNLNDNEIITAGDVDLSHTIVKNEMSPVAASQQNKASESNVVSPIMSQKACHRRWRKWKHSSRISHLGKKCLDITNKSNSSCIAVNDIGLKETDTAENSNTPNLIQSSLSPILGKIRERRFRKRKLMQTGKLGDCIQSEELQYCCRIFGSKDSLVHGLTIESTPQKHKQLNNIDDPLIFEKDTKMEVNNGVEKRQNYKNCDASAFDVDSNSIRIEDVKRPKCSDKTDSMLFGYSILVDTSVVKQCNKTDIQTNVNPPLEFGKSIDGSRQCEIKSDNLETKVSAVMFPDVPKNGSCLRESVILERIDEKRNSDGKKESPDVGTSTELMIETETSLDISMDNRAVFHHKNLPQDIHTEKLSVISPLISSPVSNELELMISSCSTPKSQKTGALTIHNQETSSDDSATSYLNSAKKKRLRLNKTGLAARLKKLLARQHSSTHIWQHETNHLNLLHSSRRGVILTVHSVWTEYSHLLVHCTTSSDKFVSPQSSEGDDSSSSNTSMRIIIVLDLSLYIWIKPWSTIRIYPPWQRLSVPRLNVTLVLGVSCVEEVQSTEKSQLILSTLVKTEQQVTETLYTCSCPCLQEVSGGKKCPFHFPHNGLEFLEYLLVQKMPMGALHCVVGQMSDTEDSVWRGRGMGTIADVVNQGCLITEDSCLQLCVLQVFCYNSRGSNKTNQNATTSYNISWSILGCDTTGECCEVVLGLGPSNAEMSQIWTSIMTRQAIGQVYKFTGFTLMRRIHRTKNPGLWPLITKCKEEIVKPKLNEKERGKHSELPAYNLKSDCDLRPVENASVPLHKKSEGNLQEMHVANCPDHRNMLQHTASELQTFINIRKDQLFVYIFSPGTNSWEMEQLERAPHGQNISVPRTQLSSLAHSLQERNGSPARYTYLAKLICATEDHLYVTDSSLSHVASAGYVIVAVKPSCFIPAQINANGTTVILLQDIQLDKGNLSADKYSWLSPVSNIDSKREASEWFPKISDQELNLTSNVEVLLPDFTLKSAAKDLVTITGTVECVDEETAFAWPVCGICENDLLLDLGPKKYLCQNCDSSSQISTKMSLEAFISFPQLPESCKVKVKLQQDSIMKLLPASQDKSQGYELSSVLGCAVGPLACVVVRAGTTSFKLNEIPTLQRKD